MKIQVELVVLFMLLRCIIHIQAFIQHDQFGERLATGCNASYDIESYYPLRLTHTMQNNGIHNTCNYKFQATDELHIIRISFSHHGSYFDAVDYVAETSDHCKEMDTSILVGTDLENVGRITYSSFLFCGDDLVLPPFVSVDYTGWVQFSSVTDMNITLTVESLSTDFCFSEDDFQCSTVECIPGTQVCDGIQQCSNGLDEYCVSDFTAIAAPSSPVCFLCDNNQCIRPRLSVYDTTGMKENWWLCDSYKHCKDGSDENPTINGTACGDIESSINIPLMTCVPTLIETNNHSVRMLASKRCNGFVDCIYPKDDPCPTPKLDNDNESSGWSTVGLVLIILVLVITSGIVVVVCWRRRAARRRRGQQDPPGSNQLGTALTVRYDAMNNSADNSGEDDDGATPVRSEGEEQ